MSTRIDRVTPGDELLVLCDAQSPIKGMTVKGVFLTKDAEYEHCAARMCRLVEWFKPEVQCDADTPPSVPPAAAPRR